MKSNFSACFVKGNRKRSGFKKSTSLLREAIESLCAFANHHGGDLIFGVTDDGKVLGQQVSDDTLKNIANTVKLNTDPKLYPAIEPVILDGKNCILLRIEESPLKPHLAYGRAYVRVGPSNQKLDREQYEYLLQQRFNGYGFDYQVQKGATLADLDTDLLYEFLETANSIRDINENLLLPPDIILQKLELITPQGELKKAALLLFGHSPGQFFSNHFEIKCGQFSSDSGYDDIANEQEFTQNLLHNFRAA